VLSNSVDLDYLFGDQDISQVWAAEIGYPLEDSSNLAHVAHYLAISSGDEFLARSGYLEFLKRQLVAQVRTAQKAPDQVLSLVESELPDLTLSQTASRLGYTDFEDQLDSPLAVLAGLPLPVFLTTGQHTLLEEALRALGKEPHTDFYRWSESLEEAALFDMSEAGDIQPTIEQPLVYHLHGLDTDPTSLVLTEDDYFDFFEHFSHDLEKSEGLPNVVRSALATTSLCLLGYHLQDWSFRVLFRGPIRRLFNPKRPLSLSIQFAPDPAAGQVDSPTFRAYLDQYFGNYKFNIYWGDVGGFTQELAGHWEG
jgi:hypothetical protein